MVKPCWEGRPYPCYEWGFNNTSECPRVIRLEDMRLGIEPCTPEQYYDLCGKQPVYYLQEMYGPDGRWQWNGHLLYSVSDSARAREVLRDHADELNVILSFEDPVTHRYFFLLQTGAPDLSEESFLNARAAMDLELKHYFCQTFHYNLNYYVRALMMDRYEIVNRDALFGPLESDEQEPKSVGEILSNFFSNLINH